jgi:hypothetical protein
MQNNIDNEEKNINNKSGGKVIASGGFGCVFLPALKCKGSNKRLKNTVSKLMTIKNAKDEYHEIHNIKDKLKMITNYQDYYLIENYTLCKPTKLSNTDMNNFTKCSALKKQNITKKNINSSLNKLLALNMPYGGITVETFITNNKNYNKLVEINNHLINLLKNGIIPMNNKNIYHSDIKSSNILINELRKNKSMNVRLIDWSLTAEYKPFKNSKFPDNWKNRPLQFNVPFSIILFTDLFLDKYSNFLNNKKNNKEGLTIFVKKYLAMWFEERGLGHFKYINKIMYMLFYHDINVKYKLSNNEIKSEHDTEGTQRYNNIKKYVEDKYTIPYIVNYLVEILLHFTKFKSDGSLNLRVYLDNVFIKIIDIWGFIISYAPLYELLFENYANLTNNQHLIIKNLKKIFIKYLYDPRIKPINIEDLERDLKEINLLIN